ncbi:MAG: DUF177 domain-containing protein [Oscillibacter sp.]|nr:DUF177 domain-containing protein [Oscillibacter sp.]
MFDKGAEIPYNKQCCPDAGILDVRPILHAPGKSISFRFSRDFSGLDFGGRKPAARPVEVEGTVRNRADALELEMTVSATLDAVCDRCGKRFPLPKTTEFRCLLAESAEDYDNDEIVLLQDGKADVGELARAAFVLDMDAKTLCSEDCKGLCPRCGANLNEGPCSCKPEADPRWAALSALLDAPNDE